MKILMFTNLYYPHVGGIQKSIAVSKTAFEQRGHEVLIVTPEEGGADASEAGVLRVPAVQNFNGSDFAVALPVPGLLSDTVDDFAPDIVHSHHPFFLGDAAVRMAALRELPLVFTYHTMWEYYTHYTPSDSASMQSFVKRMAAEYCNLCDRVIAPCGSIRDVLVERGVTTPVDVVPTGIDVAQFADGDRAAGRAAIGAPDDVPLVGYVGRLGPEKNLDFLAQGLVQLCQQDETVHVAVVGTGEARAPLQATFEKAGLAERAYLPGLLQGDDLVNAYHALDVFTFTSQSETQGLVLAEALATGTPVVALTAPGASDIVVDGTNGRLVAEHEPATFSKAIAALLALPHAQRQQYTVQARETAADWSVDACAERALTVYEKARAGETQLSAKHAKSWRSLLDRLDKEWRLWRGRASAVADAFRG